MNKGTYSILGFILIALGVLALVLSLVGVQIAFLTWIDNFGQLTGFLIRLLFIISGVVMIVMTRSGEQMHEEFFEEN